MKRTQVVLVAGQGPTDDVTGTLLRQTGTAVVEHRFDGQVVRRTVIMLSGGELTAVEEALELAHGCLACTIRNDLLVLLRKLHRRSNVERIVVHLAPWLEPEPVCWAINHVRVRVGPGYPDGPAAHDVQISGVVTCIDTERWLSQSLGDDLLPDGRTVAQAAVGQAEFADLLVLTRPEPTTLAVLRRLAPRARITVGTERVELALANLDEQSRCGRSDSPHVPLLAGLPPLAPDGRVTIVEFNARRPFRPERLHDAVDRLLDGVVRTRGRLWLANRPDHVMWLESAGGGLRVASAGKWLAAMTLSEVAGVDPERRLFADLMWEFHHGDRHTAITVLVCGADPADITSVLQAALLTDAEMADQSRWDGYDDPFGDWHQDPCHETPDAAGEFSAHRSGGEQA
ncbi:ribosome hibernation factor-recruiting GTPase MRF [Mycobacterium vicinigordonae]|uniref:GTP-binding protein n=1 Tax=Mycobacterium vicinigordonae TaxID=1719132 RepID=A0A7D6E1T7_9MYCO|nr:GTP-binding protein [Mycobacterium vicinigordonae]QLL07721.1 GTP-binding protein [Mycobacterium vicinigordonae]